MTLSPPKPTEDIGIIVGRFQTPWLHTGHVSLIESVQSLHGRVIIILGVSPVRNSLNDPLDIRSRVRMIQDLYPNIDVHSIMDAAEDKAWSMNLDALAHGLMTPTQTFRYYGGRDSFIGHYTGSRPTTVLESDEYYSATQVRKEVRTDYPRNLDFRAGMVAASAERYPTAFQTVDVAILREHDGQWDEILLGRKKDEAGWRLIGGFSDPTSESLEHDARREVYEETGLTVTDITYRFSCLVDDWRYRSGKDKIKTAVFTAFYDHGRPEAQDDIAEVKWFVVKDLPLSSIVPVHQPIFKKLYPDQYAKS